MKFKLAIVVDLEKKSFQTWFALGLQKQLRGVRATEAAALAVTEPKTRVTGRLPAGLWEGTKG